MKSRVRYSCVAPCVAVGVLLRHWNLSGSAIIWLVTPASESGPFSLLPDKVQERGPTLVDSVDVFSLVVLCSSLFLPPDPGVQLTSRTAFMRLGWHRTRSKHCLWWLLQLPYWPQFCALCGQLEITFLICGHRRTSMWIVNYEWFCICSIELYHRIYYLVVWMETLRNVTKYADDNLFRSWVRCG